ncbi:hypothetical protein SPHINGO8BC_110263 [Sphingobacterium multivorum]|uniref:Uncharacterized protein n=2 Tax=Sphingobacterium multivorum TaxID=28454 RepID=A0A653YTN0_SPHMU|nr:hypothetical protein SPHINGO8BC_110263 [Sphingobacterium multivorum]
MVFAHYSCVSNVSNVSNAKIGFEMNVNNLYKTYEEICRKRPKTDRERSEGIPLGFAEHIRLSALGAAKHVGIQEGERIIYEAYSRWPELIEDEINILRNECTIDNGNFDGLKEQGI